ncbi:hypothetical protein [Armatimonas rosea]|uniref:Uncharacterized protein n=1 Tax=Armatimonas rosea TaxID=685828 RepID=A0A7W9W7X1_ARMRO|nr:hypothetical protein [Armatimonas rosea]MBB6051525.1 hypothetical protein [Armatimonas rosea]
MTRTLPHHLAELLRACRELNTTETKALTQRLGLSSATVNVYFQRIAEALGTTDRFSSVQQAFRLGMLSRPDNNLLINSDFTEGHSGQGPGRSMPWTTVVGWAPLREATPQWVMPESEGAPGAIMMWGAGDTGEAVYQRMPPAHRVYAGRTYRFSAEYRFGPVKRDWPAVPRQPMFVDFVVRLSRGPLPTYTAPDVPGEIVTLGRLHYATRPAERLFTPASPPTPEYLEHLRKTGGEHAVQQELYTHRAGGVHLWEWEWGTLEDWTSDNEYDTLTIHPTNDLIVGTDGSNKDAPLELAWGQIRSVRLVEVV